VSEAHSEEDEDSDAGSSSDPSGDNLELQDIIASVYNNPSLQQKIKKVKQEKKKQAEYFEVEVSQWKPSTDAFLNQLNSKFVKPAELGLNMLRRKT